MTDNCFINSNSKEVVDKNLQTLKTTDRRDDTEISPIKEKATRIKDTIESVRDIINEDKERSKIRKGIVKEMIENIERQNSKEHNSLKESLSQKLKDEKTNIIVQDRIERQSSELKNATLRKKSDIGKQIDNLKKHDSPKNYDDSLKDLHERQDSKGIGKVKDMKKP